VVFIINSAFHADDVAGAGWGCFEFIRNKHVRHIIPKRQKWYNDGQLPKMSAIYHGRSPWPSYSTIDRFKYVIRGIGTRQLSNRLRHELELKHEMQNIDLPVAIVTSKAITHIRME
jgi:hypothetical protein